ncbi:MAG TPA: gamma subclass chorismate mutase AroQ, partial [Opitutaceae bacterium]
MLRVFLFPLLALLAVAAPASSVAAAAQFTRDTDLVARVVDLLDRRLAVMPEVAAIKFREKKPIADPAREQVVLDHSVADARMLQLDAEAARAFFSIQIVMARAIQDQLHAQWLATSAQPPPARDLVQAIRPELDALGRELLPAVYLASPALIATPPAEQQTRLSRLRRHAGITAEHLDELARTLGGLRLVATPTWATLQRVGVLRVGTTGDYAPFSEDATGTLRGADILLAEQLGQAWGLRVVFVRTTWPTLMADLAAQRFDLAASGISINAERSRVAAFSTPYVVDGKTPIARRADAARFATLEQIDQPGVRVIVNPGGTNERFTRENIRRASITVHPDNRTIFAEIAAGRADVMFTDGIEVRLQSARLPALSGTRAEPFTQAGKAVLLPRDSELTARVDAWLAPRIASRD